MNTLDTIVSRKLTRHLHIAVFWRVFVQWMFFTLLKTRCSLQILNFFLFYFWWLFDDIDFFNRNAITIPIKVTFCEIHWTKNSKNSPQCIILFCISWGSDEAEGRPCKLATVSILFRDKHPFFKTAQAEPTRTTSSAKYGSTGCGVFKRGAQN